jgi:DNA-binding transcriptional MocR family regulator
MNTDPLFPLSQRARNFSASEIREILKLLDQPNIISFAGGVPDSSLFPTEVIRSATAAALGSTAIAKTLQYSLSEGYAPLREWIALRLGLAASADQVLITNGAQQALDCAARLLLDPGRTVVVTNPTYLGALQIFSHYEPRFVGVPIDDGGPEINALEKAFRDGAACFYIVTNFSNPSGISVSEARRTQILELASKYQVAIIEDGAYDEIYFDERPGDSLFSRAQKGHAGACVLHCGTFSKTIAPSFRIGWLAGPVEIVRKGVLIRQAVDMHSCTLAQYVVNEVARAVFDEHTARLRRAYKARCQAMVAGLKASLPERIGIAEPKGGFFVWLELPEFIDGAALLKLAISEYSVAFVPGEAFFYDRSRKNTMRLSFSTPAPADIELGTARLGAALMEFERRGGLSAWTNAELSARRKSVSS